MALRIYLLVFWMKSNWNFANGTIAKMDIFIATIRTNTFIYLNVKKA